MSEDEVWVWREAEPRSVGQGRAEGEEGLRRGWAGIGDQFIDGRMSLGSVWRLGRGTRPTLGRTIQQKRESELRGLRGLIPYSQRAATSTRRDGMGTGQRKEEKRLHPGFCTGYVSNVLCGI
jgi:hypothetical protein